MESRYEEAYLCSRTLGRLFDADGPNGGSPSCRSQARANSHLPEPPCCSPVLQSRSLVQSPRLASWPLGLLVAANESCIDAVPAGPNSWSPGLVHHLNGENMKKR